MTGKPPPLPELLSWLSSWLSAWLSPTTRHHPPPTPPAAAATLSACLSAATRPLLHASLLLASLSLTFALLLLLPLAGSTLAGSNPARQLAPGGGGQLAPGGGRQLVPGGGGGLCDRWRAQPQLAALLGCPADGCGGAYVYVYDDLPGDLNTDLPKRCTAYSEGRNCPYYENDGLGQPDISLNWSVALQGARGSLLTPRDTWFESQNIGLDQLVHKRMLSHKCRTRDPERATAFYIPFYGTLDWQEEAVSGPDPGCVSRDRRCRALLEYLQTKPSWSRNGGMDHFLTLGYPPVFYSRNWADRNSTYGSPLLSAFPTVTVLLVEWSQWWGGQRLVSVPYPAGFHPRDMKDVEEWRARVEQVERDTLVTLVGRRRGGSVGELRNALIDQCNATTECVLAECAHGTRASPCHSNALLMELLTRSQFCLEPPGDTPTRKSTFDALVAGCIPVFMERQSIENQYPLYLPEDASTYSVFIPREEIGSGAVNVVEVLRAVPPERVAEMRRTILGLLPHLVYFQDTKQERRAPRWAAAEVVPEKTDAVDLAVAHVLAKVRQKLGQGQREG